MNKFLTLLFLVLLFSFSFCKDCNEDDEGCSKDQIPEDEKDHWKCVSLDDETCELVLLCEHAVKTDDDTTFKCSDYYVEDETEVCTENIGGTTACKAETKCSKVQKPTGEDTVICGAYPVSDKTKAFCTKDESADAEFACKEEEYVCSKVPKSLSSSIQSQIILFPMKENIIVFLQIELNSLVKKKNIYVMKCLQLVGKRQ